MARTRDTTPLSPAGDTLMDIISVYRLARLVTMDSLTYQPREWLIRRIYERAGRADEHGLEDWRDLVIAQGDKAEKPAILLVCPWCAGWWIAVGVVAARRYAPRLWGPMSRALSFSAMAGLISHAETAGK